MGRGRVGGHRDAQALGKAQEHRVARRVDVEGGALVCGGPLEAHGHQPLRVAREVLRGRHLHIRRPTTRGRRRVDPSPPHIYAPPPAGCGIVDRCGGGGVGAHHWTLLRTVPQPYHTFAGA